MAMSTEDQATTPWELIEPPTPDLDATPEVDQATAPDAQVAMAPFEASEQIESKDESSQDESLMEGEEDLCGAPSGGGLWSIPLICAGIAVIAACLIIPAADENHRLV